MKLKLKDTAHAYRTRIPHMHTAHDPKLREFVHLQCGRHGATHRRLFQVIAPIWVFFSLLLQQFQHKVECPRFSRSHQYAL